MGAELQGIESRLNTRSSTKIFAPPSFKRTFCGGRRSCHLAEVHRVRMHCASSSALREHASIRQESGKFPARNQHIFFLLVSEPICVSESMSTFEVERVDLHAVDHAAVTQTEHGPLRARDLQDPPLVRLQEQQQREASTHCPPPPCVCVYRVPSASWVCPVCEPSPTHRPC